jgi:hypothetical protein
MIRPVFALSAAASLVSLLGCGTGTLGAADSATREYGVQLALAVP